MNKNLHRAGIVVAISIPLFILPARISEGQLSDPVNLIGSEIVIFMMSLACWYSINFIQLKNSGWLGLVLSLLACCFLSNVFYFTFNPIFKDFPFRTAQNPLLIKILMLSSRGVLMSVILIPAAYFLKRDQQVRFQRQENERLALEKVKIENKLLEQAVQERTAALHQTLGSLEKVQHELEHQLYIQSRLVASITHDIDGPFNYLVVVSQTISKLVAAKQYDTIGQYSTELHNALETMFGYVRNLLEFTKLPVQQKLSMIEQVHIAEILREKKQLFDGVIRSRQNQLHVDCDPSIIISSNSNLLGVVLHNLIDNANKYTWNGAIQIKAFAQEGKTQIILENNGTPVSENVVQWVNSDGSAFENDTGSNSGIGLILVKEITSILNIGLSMHSDSNATKMSLIFNALH